MTLPGDPWTLVLAGGKGTRLAAAVPDRPKILAPIDGRTFLDLLLSQLARQKLERLAFLLGFRSDQVVAALEAAAAGSPGGAREIAWSIEPEPLGTAGAVKLAARFCDREFFLVNGDTYLDFDAQGLLAAHRARGAAVTLAAARVDDAGRYGSLDVAEDGRVVRFREKAPDPAPGLINGGVYVVAPRVLELVPSGRAVSLESEVFPELLARGELLLSVEQRGAFFDIGTESSWKSFARFADEQEKQRS